MSVLIDINTIPSVFDVTCSDHSEFKDVFEWINDRNNKATMVYGGEKYSRELSRLGKYIKYIKLLKDIRKVTVINSDKIDAYVKKLEEINSCNAFNDKHIVSIVAISNCRIVCSKDASSYPFLTDSKYYPKRIKKPKIYSGLKTKNLLCNDNIVKLLNIER